MADLTYFAGQPGFDWEVMLRDVLASGSFATVNAGPSTSIDLRWDAGSGTTISLLLTGDGINASDTRTLSAGDFDGFSLVSNNGVATTILAMTGLTSLTFEDLQAVIDGVVPSSDPETSAFHTLIAPMFTEESLTVTGSADGDAIFGSDSTDVINAGDGFNHLRPGDGVDLVSGGAGEDLLDYGWDARVFGIVADLSGATQTVTDNDGSFNTVDIISGIDDITGTQFGDILTGSGGKNVFYGGDGGDTLTGLGDNDSLFGEGGNDFISGGFGNDVVDGGAGNDTLIGGPDADVLRGGLGNDVYALENGADSIVDTGGVDTVTSTVSRSIAGYTTVEKLSLVNVATALAGTGNNLANVIVGNNFANTLTGGIGNDTLSGGSGNDTLAGGVGTDTLAGGVGNDFFVFNAPLSAANRDTITDFNHTYDTFRLENAVMTRLGAGVHALNPAFFHAGAAAADANDYIVYNKASGALSYDSNGNVAGGVTLLATLVNKPTLLANDFAVI